MSKQSKKTLKTYFKSGERPTQGKYQNLIDSFVSHEDTGTQAIKSSLNITGSLNVSSSAVLRGDITSSGNISSSGEIKGSNLSGTNTGDQDLSHLIVTESNVNLANITSSGTISSSGEIVGSNLSGTNTGDQDLSHLAVTGSNVNFTNITSSGTISSSGTVTAASFVGDGSGLTNITVTSRTESVSLVTASLATGSLIISGSDTYTSGSDTRLLGLKTSGSILPAENRTMDLGSPNNEFRKAFVKDLQLDRITSAITSSDIIPFGDNVAELGRDVAQYKIIHVTTASLARIDAKFTDNLINISGSLIPILAGNFSIGTSAKSWGDAFFSGVAAIGTLRGIANFPVNISASLVPAVDNTYDLGNKQKHYSKAYIRTGSIGYLIPDFSSSAVMNNSISISASLFPDGADTFHLGFSGKEFLQGHIRSASVDYLNSSTGVPPSGTNTGIGSFGGVATGAVFEQRIIVSASLVPHGHLMYDLGAPGTDSSGGDPHPTSGITGTARQWRNLYLEGTASLNNIAGDPDNNMYVNMSASLVPSINNTFILGNNNYQWNNIFTSTASIGFADISKLDLTDGFVNSVLNPIDDNKIDLGSRAYQWRTGHISTHSVAWIRSKENHLEEISGGEAILGTPIYVQGSLEPSVDSLYRLGSQDNEWHFIYIDGYAHLDGIANHASNTVGISASLVPNDTAVWNLGSPTNEWGDVFVTGTTHTDKLNNQGNSVIVETNLYPNTNGEHNLGNTGAEWKRAHVQTGSFGYLRPTTGDGYDTKLRISSSLVPYNNPNLDEFTSQDSRHHLGSTGDERWGDLYFDPPHSSSKGLSGLDILLIETDTGRTIRTGSAFITANNTVSNVEAGGLDTHVQFNDGGALGGDSGFTFNASTDSVFIGGNITGSNISASGFVTTTQVTASGDVSASGNLYILATESTNTSYRTLIYDTTSGRVYYTGSYAGGGGGGGDASAAGSNTQVQFNNSGEFGADAGFTYNSTTNILSTNGGFSTSGGVTASGDLSASGDLLLSGHISQSSGEENYFGGAIRLDNNKYINSRKTTGFNVNVIGVTSTNKIEIAPSNIDSVIIPTAVTASSLQVVQSGSDANQHLVSMYLSTIVGSNSNTLGAGERLIVSMSQLPYVEDVNSDDFTNLPVGSIFVHGGSGGLITGGASSFDVASGKVVRHLGIVTAG